MRMAMDATHSTEAIVADSGHAVGFDESLPVAS